MRAFTRHGENLEAHFLPNEESLLTVLITQLVELIDPLSEDGPYDDLDAMVNSLADSTDDQPIEDTALQRLFPDAYRDDRDASRDFRRYTQSEQAQAKTRSAATVLADIAASHHGRVTLPPDHVDDWLTTLTNLRLVLAIRLGIEHESDTEALSELPDDDPRTAPNSILNWCGWIQETILANL